MGLYFLLCGCKSVWPLPPTGAAFNDSKLGHSQSNEGGKDNEKGQKENATWQAISIDRKTKRDEREEANLCGEKHQYRKIEGKTRRKERCLAEVANTSSI